MARHHQPIPRITARFLDELAEQCPTADDWAEAVGVLPPWLDPSPTATQWEALCLHAHD